MKKDEEKKEEPVVTSTIWRDTRRVGTTGPKREPYAPVYDAPGVGQDTMDRMDTNHSDWFTSDPQRQEDLHLGNVMESAQSGYLPGDDGSHYIPVTSTPEAFTYESAPQFASQYDKLIKDAQTSILGRQPFEYSAKDDPLWDIYKDQYTRLGNQAMNNTMGAASANTGGLASSYAVAAGQLANQDYMAAAAAKIPELEQLAYGKYLDADRLAREDLNMLLGLDQRDYGRFADDRGQWNADRAFAYGTHRDAVGDQRYTEQATQDFWKYLQDKDWRESEAQRQQGNIEADRADQQAARDQAIAEADKDRQYDQAWKLATQYGDFSALSALGVSDGEIDAMYTLWNMGLLGGAPGAAGGGNPIANVTGRMNGTIVPGGVPGGGMMMNPFQMLQRPGESDEDYAARMEQMQAQTAPVEQGPVYTQEQIDAAKLGHSRPGDRFGIGKVGHNGGQIRSMGDTSKYDHNRVWGPGSPAYDAANGILSVGEAADLMEVPDWVYEAKGMTPPGLAARYNPSGKSGSRSGSSNGGAGGTGSTTTEGKKNVELNLHPTHRDGLMMDPMEALVAGSGAFGLNPMDGADFRTPYGDYATFGNPGGLQHSGVPSADLADLGNKLTAIEDSYSPENVPRQAKRVIRSYVEDGRISEEYAMELLHAYGYD